MNKNTTLQAIILSGIKARAVSDMWLMTLHTNNALRKVYYHPVLT